MARFSQPSGKFRVWDQDADPYQHPDLQVNWDSLDAMIGAPTGGTWPPSGQSIYSILQSLTTATAPLGAYMMWHRFEATQPLPSGWVECNGQTILAANHDLVDGNGVHLGNVTLPDFRNAFPIGADSSLILGTASSVGQGSTFAPGIGGAGGSNGQLTHSHTLPSHYHDHPHIHEVGNINGGVPETSDARAGQTTAASGGGVTVNNPNHNHNVDIYSSQARRDDTPNYKVVDAPNNNSQTQRTQTSLQKIATGGSGTDPTGGSIGQAITLSTNQDARPYHIGVLVLIRVKNS
jgi:hypothetical protein